MIARDKFEAPIWEDFEGLNFRVCSLQIRLLAEDIYASLAVSIQIGKASYFQDRKRKLVVQILRNHCCQVMP